MTLLNRLLIRPEWSKILKPDTFPKAPGVRSEIVWRDNNGYSPFLVLCVEGETRMQICYSPDPWSQS